MDELTDDEALIVTFGRVLLEVKKIEDSTFAAIRASWGERGLLELTALLRLYMMNAVILRVMDHQATPDARHLSPRPPAAA